MAFNIIGSVPWQDTQATITKSRLDTANSFRRMVDAKSAAGEDVDPTELYRMKMNMTGGDPFKAQYISSGDALNSMAKQANQRASMARAEVGFNTANFARQQNDMVQELIYDNWQKSPEEFPQLFTDIFGKDTGSKFYSQYREQLPTMLDEAHSRKMAEVMQDPRAKLIYNDADITRLFPSQSQDKGMRSVLKNIAQSNSREMAAIERQKLLQTINAMPEGMLNQDEATQRQFFQAMGVNPDRAMTISQSLGKAQSFDKTSTIIKDMMNNPALASRMYLAGETGNQDLVLEAANAAGMAYGVSYNGTDDPNFKRLMSSINANNTITDIAEYDSKRDALIQSYQKTADAEADHVRAAYVPGSVAGYINQNSGTDPNQKKMEATTLNMSASILFGTKDTQGPVFASKENVDAFFAFVNSAGPDLATMDPAAVANAFIQSGAIAQEDRASYVTRKVDEAMYPTYGPRPGSQFNSWVVGEVSGANTLFNTATNMVKTIDASSDNSALKQQKKSLVVNNTIKKMTDELNNFRSITSDPRKTNNFSNFNESDASNYVETISNHIKELKAIDLSLKTDPIARPGTNSSFGSMTPGDQAAFAPIQMTGDVNSMAQQAGQIGNNLKRQEEVVSKVRTRIAADADSMAHLMVQANKKIQGGMFNSQALAARREVAARMREQAINQLRDQYGGYVSDKEIAETVDRSIEKAYNLY